MTKEQYEKEFKSKTGITHDAFTILVQALGNVAMICEKIGLAGFAVYNCGHCPDWHAGTYRTNDKGCPLFRGTSGDPVTACGEMVEKLLKAHRLISDAAATQHIVPHFGGIVTADLAKIDLAITIMDQEDMINDSRE